MCYFWDFSLRKGKNQEKQQEQDKVCWHQMVFLKKEQSSQVTIKNEYHIKLTKTIRVSRADDEWWQDDAEDWSGSEDGEDISKREESQGSNVGEEKEPSKESSGNNKELLPKG